MSVYCVRLKALSVLTKFPDAQTIFGAFCYKYLHLFGKEKLDALLSEEYSNPFFAISSLLYENTVPVPLDFAPRRKTDLSCIKIEDNYLFKKIKKIKFFSIGIFNLYKQNKELFEEQFYDKINTDFEIINSEIICLKNENMCKEKYYVVDARTRNSFSTEDKKKLFKDEVMYINDNVVFSVYVLINNQKYENEIIETFSRMSYTSLGGFKSIGYNLFSVIDVKEFSNLGTNKYGLLLSKCLIDDSFDVTKASYNLMRINNKATKGQDKYHSCITCICEGSVVDISNKIIGSLVKETNGDTINYQNYLGFVI